jgi:hypothetical protein
MNKFFYVSLLLATSVLCNCSQEDVVNKENVGTTTDASPDVVKMQAVAKLLTGLTADQRIAKEVRAGVERSLTYGLDEEFRFTDILQPKESKMLRSGDDNLLAESVRDLLNGYNSASGLRSSGNELETFLLDENIQIYWPYSEDWDEQETPVITFDPGTGNADKVIAYRVVKLPDGTVVTDSLIVDEAYAMKHPVWVINKNDVDYEDLPDFFNDEHVKNGVFFHSALSQKKRNGTDNILRSSTSDSIFVFKLGTLQATRHHDDWVNGGSEFEFKCSIPLAPSYSTTGVSTIRKDIARKHINANGTIFTMNMPLNTNWTEEQVQNGLKVIESDGGGTRNWTFQLGVSISKVNGSVNAAIPYGSNDDGIYEQILDRKYILSTENLYAPGSPKTHLYRGLKWTMYIQPATYVGY